MPRSNAAPIDAVLAAEERLRLARPRHEHRAAQPPRLRHPRSAAATTDELSQIRFIEVKGRVAGADTVTVSRNEILTALNEPDQFVLALVEVAPDGDDAVRYLRRPFTGRRRARCSTSPASTSTGPDTVGPGERTPAHSTNRSEQT